MNTTFDILVIVLSCLLAIFLVICITTAIIILKLVKSLRAVVAKGEHLVDSAEEIGETIKQNIGAVSILKNVTNVMRLFNKVKKG